MDSMIAQCLAGLEFGQMQTFKNLSILPLFTSTPEGVDYLTLQEALDEKLLIITEVDQSGSVPELKVINTSEHLILMLDGEELMGAKQNRVLNTSILLQANSKTLIPVSCTERGRWAYTSAAFAYSGAIMSHSVRSDKLRAVTSSLQKGRGHTSDQKRVWDKIAGLHRMAGTSSPTGAMRDAYVAKTGELDTYLNAFEPVPQQRGCMVFINGQAVGFDLLSRQSAYASLHPQLVKSYAMDALLQNGEQAHKPPSSKKAEAFLQQAAASQESRFDAVGLGEDYRYVSATVVGSALVFSESVIHVAFFKAEEDKPDTPMAGYLQRRHFRRRK